MPAALAGSLIGSGHYNGHHETVVFRVPPIRLLAVSPEGHYVAVVRQVSRHGGLLQMWDVPAGQLAFEWHEPLGITAIAFHPGGRSMAWGAGDHSVVVRALPSGEPTRWTGHRQSIGALGFSPDGTQLASFANDGRLLIRDVARGNVLAEVFDAKVRIATTVHFVDAGELWTLGDDRAIRRYRLEGANLTLHGEVKLPEEFAAAASTGDKLYGLRPDQRLDVVDATTGKASAPIVLDALLSPAETNAGAPGRNEARVVATNVSATSHDLAILTDDGRLSLLPGTTGKANSWPLGIREARALAGDPNGRFWAAAGGDGGIVIFDRDEPDTPHWLEPRTEAVAESRPPSRFDSGHGLLISLHDPQSIHVVDLATGVTKRRLERPATDASPAATVTALCADRETVLCGTSAGTVEVFPPGSASAQIVRVGKTAVTALGYSPRGGVALAGDASGAIAWIDLNSPSAKAGTNPTGPVHIVAFSSDGRWAATADNARKVGVWDVASRSLRHTLNGHKHEVRSIAFSPDGQTLVSGDAHGDLIRWNLSTGEQSASWSFRSGLVASPTDDARQTHGDHGITAIAFRHDQRVLAAGTAGGYTQTFDLERGTELSPVFQRSAVTDLAFTQDGASLLVAMQSGEVTRWWQAPDPPRMLTGHQGSVRFAALDAAGRRAVTGGTDRKLRIWDVDQRSLVGALDNGGEAITAGALSRDGMRAVTSGYGSGITLWNLTGMTSLGKRYGHKKRVWWFDFAPDGTRFASASDDQTVKLWEFASQKLLHTIELDAPVHFVRFSPDGTRLVTSTTDPRGWQFPARLQIWNAGNGKPLVELRGHRTTVNAAVFRPDGIELTSCGADGQVCRWNVATGERLQDDSHPHGLSHAGLIGGGILVMRRFNTGIFVERLGSLERLSEFDVPTRSIGDLNVSAQGNRIIAGTEEGPVYVWGIGHE